MVKVKSYYINALKLGLLIVVSLLLINYLIDQKRISNLEEEFLKESWEMEDSKLFLLFTDFIGKEDEGLYCGLLEKRLNQIVNRNSKFLKDLESYEEVNVFSGDYERLKNTFLLKNLELFFYYVDFKSDCNANVNYILYFYPTKSECSSCEVQADVLDNVRDDCKNVVNFALPVDSDLDIINLISSKYGITGTPSIVINDEFIFKDKIVNKDEILNNISCEE